jgi:tetratricopeptide (TPR) repeat protein
MERLLEQELEQLDQDYELEQLNQDYELRKELEDDLRVAPDASSRKSLERKIQILNQKIEERKAKIRGINPLSQTIFEGRKFLKDREFNRAEEKFDQANRLEPESPEPWYWKAKVALAKGNSAVALKYINKALDMDAHHWHSLVLKIKLLLLSGGKEKLEAEKIAKQSRGIADDLDVWLNCLEQEKMFTNLVITISELDRRCPPPDYQW